MSGERALNKISVINCLKLLKIQKTNNFQTSQCHLISKFYLKMEKKSLFSPFFFNKTQMFEFYHYSNFGNVCVELKIPLPTDFATNFRYRSQSLLGGQMCQLWAQMGLSWHN